MITAPQYKPWDLQNIYLIPNLKYSIPSVSSKPAPIHMIWKYFLQEKVTASIWIGKIQVSEASFIKKPQVPSKSPFVSMTIGRLIQEIRWNLAAQPDCTCHGLSPELQPCFNVIRIVTCKRKNAAASEYQFGQSYPFQSQCVPLPRVKHRKKLRRFNTYLQCITKVDKKKGRGLELTNQDRFS